MDNLAGTLAVWLGIAVCIGLLAKKWKDRDPVAWTLIGLTGVVGLVLLASMPRRATEKAQEATPGAPS